MPLTNSVTMARAGGWTAGAPIPPATPQPEFRPRRWDTEEVGSSTTFRAPASSTVNGCWSIQMCEHYEFLRFCVYLYLYRGGYHGIASEGSAIRPMVCDGNPSAHGTRRRHGRRAVRDSDRADSAKSCGTLSAGPSDSAGFSVRMKLHWLASPARTPFRVFVQAARTGTLFGPRAVPPPRSTTRSSQKPGSNFGPPLLVALLIGCAGPEHRTGMPADVRRLCATTSSLARRHPMAAGGLRIRSARVLTPNMPSWSGCGARSKGDAGLPSFSTMVAA